MSPAKSGLRLQLAAATISTLLLSPLLWFGFGPDQGLFAYSGWAWRSFGAIPYRDIFEQNFPGIFLINYFAQAVLGDSVTSFRFFDLAWQAATAMLIYSLASTVSNNRLAGLLAAIFYPVYYVSLGQWHTGQRDGFLLLLYLAGARMFLRERPSQEARRSLAAGCLMGLAFLIKPVAALPGLVMLAMVTVKSRAKILPAAAFLAGCSIPQLAVILYYLVLGALPELYKCLFVFSSRVYIDYQMLTPTKIIANIFMTYALRLNPMIFLGAALALLTRRRIPDGQKQNLLWLVLMLLSIYLGFVVQGKYGWGFFYHEAPVMGALCMLAGAGWAGLFRTLAGRMPSWANLFTACLTILLLAANYLFLSSSYAGVFQDMMTLTPSQAQMKYSYQNSCAKVAERILAKAGPGDKVQVWGDQALVNFLAKLEAPTRFPYTLQLVPFRPGAEPSGIQKQLGREWLAGLEKDPPRFFIVSRHGYYQNKDLSFVFMRDYPDVRYFIARNYQYDDTIDGMEIYQRVH